MEQLYNVNGLIFWSEREIKARRMVETHLVQAMKDSLKRMNRAWEFFQVEAPILTPWEFINKNYTDAEPVRDERDSEGQRWERFEPDRETGDHDGVLRIREAFVEPAQ